MTTEELIKRGQAIDKIIEEEDVSCGELTEYQWIISELHTRGVISDDVMQEIESGEIGTIDMYIANSKS